MVTCVWPGWSCGRVWPRGLTPTRLASTIDPLPSGRSVKRPPVQPIRAQKPCLVLVLTTRGQQMVAGELALWNVKFPRKLGCLKSRSFSGLQFCFLFWSKAIRVSVTSRPCAMSFSWRLI